MEDHRLGGDCEGKTLLPCGGQISYTSQVPRADLITETLPATALTLGQSLAPPGALRKVVCVCLRQAQTSESRLLCVRGLSYT